MKVLVTSGHLERKGGIVNYVDQLIDNLEQKEIDVEHFVHGLKPKYHKNWVVPLAWSYQFLKFSIELDSKNPDIVHINPSLNRGSIIRDFIFLKISKNKGYPVVLFFRGWRWNLFDKIKANRIFRKKFIKNLENVDQIIVLSEDFKKALVELGIDGNKIKISSTMVEVEAYRSNNKKIEEPYNILFCGNIAETKGVYELLESINRVIEHEKDVNFIFMGDGPELERLQNRSKELNIERFVTFTGYMTGEEKYEVYKTSDLFVLPSYTEGFPNVALEAMAAGLPIIATSVGALKYAIKENKNGLKINSVPPNPEEIGNKIIELIEDQELMEKISEFNIREAENKYSVESVANQMIDIYEEVK